MSKSTLRRLGKTMRDDDAMGFLVDYFPCVANLKAENAALKREIEKLREVDSNESVKLLRLCATTMDDWSSWDNSIVRARANWLRLFASHIESLLTTEGPE